MGKGSTQNLISKILESLSNRPKSISQIVKETGLDRSSISRYLKILKQNNIIIEEKKGTSKIFILKNNNKKDTYFGLYLDSKTDKLIDSIYYLIQKKWTETTKRKLLKTTAQKIIYQVIEKNKLNIPHGWYIYGGVCIKPYNNTKNYKYYEIDKEIKYTISETVIEYSKNNFEYESKQLQYKKAGKELYNTKEDILKLLYSKRFSKNSMYVFQKLFSKFYRLTPKADKLYDDLLNDYDTLLIDITKEWNNFVDEKNERNFAEFKQKLISSFETIWKMVAMINFKIDLYTGGFYLEKELNEHFKLEFNQAKEDVIEIGSELNEMIPFEEPDDPLYQEFKKIIKNIKPADPEELRKQNEEFDKIEKEQGLEALGKELRRRAGLE